MKAILDAFLFQDLPIVWARQELQCIQVHPWVEQITAKGSLDPRNMQFDALAFALGMVQLQGVDRGSANVPCSGDGGGGNGGLDLVPIAADN